VLIADELALVRDGLAAAVGRHDRIEVVGLAADAAQVVAQARALRPDVVLLELRMPDPRGGLALETLRAALPRARVLVLSPGEDGEDVVRAIAAGAGGHVSKRASWQEICGAVLAIHRGEAVVSPTLTRHLVDAYRRAAGRPSLGPVGQLAGRELAVLRLIAEGATDHEISHSLYVSPRTVQNDLARIRRKTGVRRRAELAHWAARHVVA
jgi:two-component system NarL family response regulator